MAHCFKRRVFKHGEPETPADLARHTFIVLVTSAGPLNTFHFVVEEQPWDLVVPMSEAWETNDGALAREWALAGHGIARKNIWDAAMDIRAGRLKVVLPDFCICEAGVYAVLHSNRYRSPRVRVLLDFLIERFNRATAELLLDTKDAAH